MRQHLIEQERVPEDPSAVGIGTQRELHARLTAPRQAS